MRGTTGVGGGDTTNVCSYSVAVGRNGQTWVTYAHAECDGCAALYGHDHQGGKMPVEGGAGP